LLQREGRLVGVGEGQLLDLHSVEGGPDRAAAVLAQRPARHLRIEQEYQVAARELSISTRVFLRTNKQLQDLLVAAGKAPAKLRRIETEGLLVGGLLGNDLIGTQAIQAAQKIVQIGVLSAGLNRLGHPPHAVHLGEDGLAVAALQDDLVGAGEAGQIAVAELQRSRHELLRQIVIENDDRHRIVHDGVALVGVSAACAAGLTRFQTSSFLIISNSSLPILRWMALTASRSNLSTRRSTKSRCVRFRSRTTGAARIATPSCLSTRA